MKLLSPTPHKRLNEVAGLILLSLGLLTLLSVVSYHPQDASWDTAAGAARPLNLIGYPGAYISDLLLQLFGLAAFAFPLMTFLLAWKWVRSEEIEAPVAKIAGSILIVLSVAASVSFLPPWTLFGNAVRLGGALGLVLAAWLAANLNLAGALVLLATTLIVSVYLVSTFTMAKLAGWFAGPLGVLRALGERWNAWRERRRERKLEKKREQVKAKQEKRRKPKPEAAREPEPVAAPVADDAPPFDPDPEPAPELVSQTTDIPICPLEEAPTPEPPPAAVAAPAPKPHTTFRLPGTDLLNEPPGRSAYDEQELKNIAVAIKAKFEEFNVLGSVVQINPGPVVTTFEFKPEAGIKYSRIIGLTEDLCLALQAESILIERIPGKSTVGIEVPNDRRQTIALREILEATEFSNSSSKLTLAMGRDLHGRIRVTDLASMPHLLIAGSTGTGKSVFINSLMMSILYKATPDDVKMVLVDPKRLELNLYEGIPHLLAPVVTDPKVASNVLRNATREMENRLKLLAQRGVRNIDQYNRTFQKQRSLSLFDAAEESEHKPLPYLIIVIDELADLMMVDTNNVEESITRLAQMARAVGIHLILATQRPSVDVITGLIKANFPARISFRVASKVDSRTIFDSNGSESLLGKGDMLYLPAGSARLHRIHGPLVTEEEISAVCDFWRQQAPAKYNEQLLEPPKDDDEQKNGSASEGVGEGGGDTADDDLYHDAVRVCCE